jgi:peptidoglycan/xylan/chitin deacetylase (PgdA/CDA1 family)
MKVAALKRVVRNGLGRMAPVALRLRPKQSLVVLMYHRVLPNDHPDRRLEQPGMLVSPDTLAMHLRVLRKRFEIVDLGEWVSRRLEGRPLPIRACSITFDDGWRDNFDFALPVLRQADVPATIFLVADFIGTKYEFWPNRLARLIVKNGNRGFETLPRELRDLLARLDVRSAADSTSSLVTQVDVAINACKVVSDDFMQQILGGAESELRRDCTDDRRTLLNESEIDEMARSGRIRFGSHGRRHLRLIEGLATATVGEEIVESREILRRLTGQPVDVFCYPNGNYSDAALEMVRETYPAAVTTISGWNGRSTDLHLMHRVPVHDDISTDERSFLARVCGFV